MENEKNLSNTDPETLRASRRDMIRARAGAEAKFAFYIHLAAYVMVNLLLIFINAMTTPLFWWVQWSLMGWGFALLIHALISFLLPDLFGARRRMYKKELTRQVGK
ncbi:MAG TPA: 2TM domain-containing protein [bacterium]|nr:2TM domain-containing protein [bacterium]